MAVFFYVDPSTEFSPEIDYTVDLFFQTYGISYTRIYTLRQLDEGQRGRRCVLLVYADPAAFERLLKSSRFCRQDAIFLANIFDNSLREPRLSEVVESEYGLLKEMQSGRSVPVPIWFEGASIGEHEAVLYGITDSSGKTMCPGVTYVDGKNTMYIYVDVFASAFYFISLVEESLTSKRDKHSRFVASSCRKKRQDIIERPVVEEYFSVLHTLVLLVAQKAYLPVVRKCFWPKNEDYAVCLTHDADIIHYWFLYSLVRFFQLARRADLGSIVRMAAAVLSAVLNGRNPANTFSRIAAWEAKSGFRSSFYFMAGKPTLASILKSDITYNVRRQSIRRTIEDIEARGFEVGLHGSYDSYADYRRLSEEKAILNKISSQSEYGVRQHFVRFDPQATWEIQARNGLLYDSTLGYADRSGYRAGYSFPFYPYNARLRKGFTILELPFTIMDRTFSKYQQAKASEVWGGLIGLISRATELGGIVGLIWHNHTGDEFGFIGYSDVYERLLTYLQSQRAFVGSGRDICRWWIARENVVCVESTVRAHESIWRFTSNMPTDEITFEIAGVVPNDCGVIVENAGFERHEEEKSIFLRILKLEAGQTFSISLKRSSKA